MIRDSRGQERWPRNIGGKNKGQEERCEGRQVGDRKGLYERMKFVRITEGTFIYRIDCIDFHYINCIIALYVRCLSHTGISSPCC